MQQKENKPDIVDEENALKGKHLALGERTEDRTQCILNSVITMLYNKFSAIHLNETQG